MFEMHLIDGRKQRVVVAANHIFSLKTLDDCLDALVQLKVAPIVEGLVIIVQARAVQALHKLGPKNIARSEEHTSELQSRPHLVCRLLLEKKKKKKPQILALPKHHLTRKSHKHHTLIPIKPLTLVTFLLALNFSVHRHFHT